MISVIVYFYRPLLAQVDTPTPNPSALFIVAALITIAGAILWVYGNISKMRIFLINIQAYIGELRYSIKRAHNQWRQRKFVIAMWSRFVRAEFTVVVPSKDVDEMIRGTQYLDYLGVEELIDELQEEFDDLNFDRLPDDDLSERNTQCNIITVAGPIPNQVTQRLLEQPEIIYKFDKDRDGNITHTIINENRGSQLELELNPILEEDQASIDFGILTRAKNPYAPDKIMVNAAGQFGWGTRAGFQLLQDPDTLQYILDQGGEYFQAIYAVSIDENGNLLSPHLLDLHPDDDLQRTTIISLYE